MAVPARPPMPVGVVVLAAVSAEVVSPELGEPSAGEYDVGSIASGTSIAGLSASSRTRQFPSVFVAVMKEIGQAMPPPVVAVSAAIKAWNWSM